MCTISTPHHIGGNCSLKKRGAQMHVWLQETYSKLRAMQTHCVEPVASPTHCKKPISVTPTHCIEPISNASIHCEPISAVPTHCMEPRLQTVDAPAALTSCLPDSCLCQANPHLWQLSNCTWGGVRQLTHFTVG